MIRLHRLPRRRVVHERRFRVARWGFYVVLRDWAYAITWGGPFRVSGGRL